MSVLPGQAAGHKASQQSAADILGLNKARMSAQQGLTLDMEVDQYLSDPNPGTGTLEFWQVVYFSIYS